MMDGIAVVNKPIGMTSHDVVDMVRRRFKIRRVGHAGTLDPLASGVLIILIGKSTALSGSFMNDDKEYIATIYFGKKTDTQDSAGRVIEEKEIDGLDEGSVKKALISFLGEIQQVPPMVSAKKYKGKRLYQLARKGLTIERKPCNIKIYDIKLVEFNLPEVVIRVRCSKGTYVRTLCEDIGRILGYPSHMSALTRSASGRFSLEEAIDPDVISEKDIQTV